MAKAYVEIPLKNSDKVALVDAGDAEKVIAAGPWAYLSNGGKNAGGSASVVAPGLVRLSRMLLGLEKGDPRIAEHGNGNPLDNRRENLQIATPGENGQNRGKQTNNNSGYKGVTAKADGTFIMQIYTRTRPDWLPERKSGLYHLARSVHGTAEEAALAYDEAARRFFIPEFARFNFPNIGERGLDGELRTI